MLEPREVGDATTAATRGERVAEDGVAVADPSNGERSAAVAGRERKDPARSLCHSGGDTVAAECSRMAAARSTSASGPTSRLHTSSATAPRLPDAGQNRALPLARRRISQLPVHSFLHVMCSSTPAGWQRLALSALHMLRSTFETASAPAAYIFRGSIRHPMQSLCTLRGRRCRRLTQHLLPGALLGLPGPVFHRLDCTSFGWRLLRINIRRPRQACRTKCG